MGHGGNLKGNLKNTQKRMQMKTHTPKFAGHS